MESHLSKRVVCWHCGKQGHKKAQCPDRTGCWLCGRQGHQKAQCPDYTGCWHCGKHDHYRAHCPDLVCKDCGLHGHKAANCTTEWCELCACFGHADFECDLRDLFREEPGEFILTRRPGTEHVNLWALTNTGRADAIDNWRNGVPGVKGESAVQVVDWQQIEAEGRQASDGSWMFGDDEILCHLKTSEDLEREIQRLMVPAEEAENLRLLWQTCIEKPSDGDKAAKDGQI